MYFLVMVSVISQGQANTNKYFSVSEGIALSDSKPCAYIHACANEHESELPAFEMTALPH